MVLALVFLLGGLGCDKPPEISPVAMNFDEPKASSQPQTKTDKDTAGVPKDWVGVAPPWSAEALRQSMKVGRRWTLQEQESVWVGPKKTTKTWRIEAEIVEKLDEGVWVKVRTLDAQGAVLAEKRKFQKYDSVRALYNGFKSDETEVEDKELNLAGRKWSVRIYRNRRVVDFQEQMLEIWASLEVPGLSLRMSSKMPRRHNDLVLTSFHDAP